MKTPLYNCHLERKGQLVDFSGWQLPLKYQTSIKEEHLWVRSHAGLFDVSHMGFITISGSSSKELLNYLSCNDIANIVPGKAIYTPLANNDGYCIDDIIIYCIESDFFYIVANAANKQTVYTHLLQHNASYNCTINHHFETHGILAIQGSSTPEIISKLIPHSLTKPMLCEKNQWNKEIIYISSTGYTGEKGFEIIAPNNCLEHLYTSILDNPLVKPIGLGARDTLRLEKGYALYGHELSLSISPIESIASWAVKMAKPNFLGKEAMSHMTPRKAIAIKSYTKQIPRSGDKIYYKNHEIGIVTSGNFSFSLEVPIGLGLINQVHPNLKELIIRGPRHEIGAYITTIPFI